MDRPPAPITADPILIATNSYITMHSDSAYIVHKWGDEHINWLRKAVYAPFTYRKTVRTAIVTSTILCLAYILFEFLYMNENIHFRHDPGFNYFMHTLGGLFAAGVVIIILLSIYNGIVDRYDRSRLQPFK